MTIEYMSIYNSPKPSKRFQAIFYDEKGRRIKTTHFGQANPKIGTYIDHKDKNIRKNYIARHKVNEDWSDPTKAGTLSRYILWGDETSLLKAISSYRKRFHLSSLD